MPFATLSRGLGQGIRKAKRLGTGVVVSPYRQLRGYGVVNFRGRGMLNLIDVGSVGQLPEPWYSHADKVKHLLKFEPREHAARSAHITSVDAALWSESAERDFYIYRGNKGSGSSLFPQNVEYVREHYESLRQRGPADLARTWFERSDLKKVERIKCRSLDEIIAEADGPAYHFIKIDTQGAEQQILAGAERFLAQHCLGLHLELFTIPLYTGISLMPEVISYLDGRGFFLAKKFPPHGSFHSQNDCLFLRRDTESTEMAVIRQVYGV